MKVVLILFIAGLAGYTKGNNYNEIESIGVFQALAIDFIGAHSCSGSSLTQLKEEKQKAAECIKDIRSNSSFCETFVHHFKPCVRGLQEESQKCEETSRTESKNAIINSAIEVAKYICDTDGEHILELVNPCVLESVKKSRECRKNITQPLVTNDLTVICSTLPSLQKCFEDKIPHHCENEITRTAVHDFFSIDAKPCNIAKAAYFELLGWRY